MIKIKENKNFSDNFFKNLSKFANVNKKDDIYEFTEIKNMDLFLYNIAKEINKIGIKLYFKEYLNENFSKKKTNEIIQNYKTLSNEFEHLEILIKIYLRVYFNNDNVLNLNSFFKFNINTYIKEYKRICNLEIEEDGEFLTNNLEEDNENDFEIADDSINNIINFIKELKEKKEIQNNFTDIHIYLKNDELITVNEYNKKILYFYKENIDKFYNEFYLNIMSYDLFNLLVQISLNNPERIIIYNSLNESFLDDFKNYYNILHSANILKADLYKSSDNVPIIKS